MLLLIRRLKQSLYMNNEFRMYLLYALGEMVLVIIGILIALQIDNWNTARKDRQTLDSYLQTIARNVSTDLAAANEMRAQRESAYEANTLALFVDRGTTLDVNDVAAMYAALVSARTLLELETNSSGYDALKASGNLDKLQGADIEGLLYDYYDTLSRIEGLERSYNEYARLLWIQLLSDWPDGIGAAELADPNILPPSEFEVRRSEYKGLLFSAHAEALVLNALSVGPLLLEYERLDSLGDALVYMADNDLMDFDATTGGLLDSIYNPSDGLGLPNVVENGRIPWYAYWLFAEDSNNTNLRGFSDESAARYWQNPGIDLDSIEWFDDSIRIDYAGGAEWAGIWIAVGQSGISRRSMDFSGFDTLLLELKGDQPGETFMLSLEDIDDLGGLATFIDVELTDQWQTYEFDLSIFDNADLTRLRVVAGFVFDDQPSSFSIRTIRFLDTD